ncbi:uncharacterized protein LOC127162076 isoform X2 [Labeo rohita]|nr:uncharacterized protein LOC127162076 isoform X2 [Labeo rohita]
MHERPFVSVSFWDSSSESGVFVKRIPSENTEKKVEKAVLCLKMLLLRYSTAVICAVFIATGAVSGEDQIKAVGDTVSFRPTNPPVTSIIWKHRSSSGVVIKAIEWDDDGFNIPSPRFKGITTLDEKTGQITITNLAVEHSGVYTIDINSKEQEQRFSLKVISQNEKEVFGALGGEVSFGPGNLNPGVTSIIWKQRSSSGVVVKAIEWDDDGLNIPNPGFRGITKLDRQTGQITISNLNADHSGVYTIDINSKEQEQRFRLELLPPVPKPVIKIDRTDKYPNVVYLICEYSEQIIWKNSAGENLVIAENHPKGKFITVKQNGNPESYYTCTLKNAVSEATSDPVYKRDLFEAYLWGFVIWIAIVSISMVFIILFLFIPSLYHHHE